MGDKIEGYDKYEIENAARTIIDARKIINDNKRFPVVQRELMRQAKAAKEAALETKVGKKLRAL